MDPSERDSGDMSLLHLAAHFCPDLVPHLIEAGADVTALNEDKELALHFAVAGKAVDAYARLPISPRSFSRI